MEVVKVVEVVEVEDTFVVILKHSVGQPKLSASVVE